MVSYAMTYSGQDFLNEDGTAVNLLGTKGIEAMQNFADLITKYRMAPSPVQSKTCREVQLPLLPKRWPWSGTDSGRCRKSLQIK